MAGISWIRYSEVWEFRMLIHAHAHRRTRTQIQCEVDGDNALLSDMVKLIQSHLLSHIGIYMCCVRSRPVSKDTLAIYAYFPNLENLQLNAVNGKTRYEYECAMRIQNHQAAQHSLSSLPYYGPVWIDFATICTSWRKIYVDEYSSHTVHSVFGCLWTATAKTVDEETASLAGVQSVALISVI